MANKQYSSPMIQALMENDHYSFWRSDWSERIIVKWDKSKVPVERFSAQIRQLVGVGFMYEPSLSGNPAQYEVIGDKHKASLQTV